jgi:glycerophosphoryl diester phosphodiesterase
MLLSNSPDSSPTFDVGAFAYAHRGLWDGSLPENSLAAFHAAAAAGLGVELDVRVTADGERVVFHDATLMRMCEHAARVDELTFPELRRVHLPDGSRIPTLREALDAMAGLPTLVEIKIDPAPIGAEPNRSAMALTLDTLRRTKAIAGVMSFDEPSVSRLITERDAAFPWPIGQLIEPVGEIGEDGVLDKARRATARGVDYLAPHVSSLEAVAAAHPNQPLVTWTVRRPEDLAAARKRGAAPIFEGFSPALAKPV